MTAYQIDIIMNKDLRPEDFWPEAENLLDNHYSKTQSDTVVYYSIDNYWSFDLFYFGSTRE